MKKYPNLVKFLVLVLVFIAGGYSHKGYVTLRHPLKHQGPCQIMSRRGQEYWFIRPNGEMFEMFLDNPVSLPWFTGGLELEDLIYTDDTAWMQHLVRPQLKKVTKPN